MHLTPRAVAGLLAAAGLLAGCAATGTDAPPTGGSTLVTPPTAESAAPGPAVAPSTPATWLSPTAAELPGTPLTSGGMALSVQATAVQAVAQPDGSVLVTVTVDPPGTAARITADAGSSLQVLADGSVTVSDATGALVGGLTRALDPAVGGAARFTATADGTVEVSSAIDPDSTTFEFWFATATIETAEWGEREGGRSLAVVPAAWTRAAGAAGREAGWAGLVRLVPEADSPGMRDQFDCHAIGAPDKASWNLEPWRPDVGAFGVLAAACNP